MQQTQSTEETERFGAELGRRLRGGEVIELRSDVGGGKTTLTRGIVLGAGSAATVGSPTFTVTKQYPIEAQRGRGLTAIVHADMYRLQDPGIIRHELADILDEHTTLVIEWAESVEDVLPAERVLVELLPTADETTRDIAITVPESLNYMLDGLA